MFHLDAYNRDKFDEDFDNLPDEEFEDTDYDTIMKDFNISPAGEVSRIYQDATRIKEEGVSMEAELRQIEREAK